jgi:tRNA (uracil-5-)-methyltransferase TRM9
VLIYVWAIEQDELSKRRVVEDQEPPPSKGKDVVVPWVLSKELSRPSSEQATGPQVYNRYYHMFAKGELLGLVLEAAAELRLQVGPKPKPKPDGTAENTRGVEIVQDGWERSNYYVEVRLWQTL